MQSIMDFNVPTIPTDLLIFHSFVELFFLRDECKNLGFNHVAHFIESCPCRNNETSRFSFVSNSRDPFD